MGNQFSESYVTDCLRRASLGEVAARDEAYRIVSAELRRIAEAKLRCESSGLTLQATCLVNDAFLKLIDASNVQWENRRHFLIFAAQEMRRILVDHARRRSCEKRGAGNRPIDLADATVSAGTDADPALIQESHERVLAVDKAMANLKGIDPLLAEIVELKFFGGHSFSTMAEILETPVSTLKSRWAKAKVLLRQWLDE